VATHVKIEHTTRYRYDRPVALSPHLIRLRPAPHTRTPIHQYRMEVSGGNYTIHWQQDPFGNFIARAVFSGRVTELTVSVTLTAELTIINPFDFFVEKYAENYPFQYDALLEQELLPYFEITEEGPLLQCWLASISREPCAIVSFLGSVNSCLQQAINYAVRLEPGIQRCETTLEKALGSCRDTSWLLVQILRHIGLAARFVSGYLIQLIADQPALDGPSGTDTDFTDLHAWVEVYIPGAGWIGLDPTSGLFAGEGHIPLSCTPDPVSAAPIVGSSEPCEAEFKYENRVLRVREDARVTLPYTHAQWAEICRLGDAVDIELDRDDVRLTMRGEPVFVAGDESGRPEKPAHDPAASKANIPLSHSWGALENTTMLCYEEARLSRLAVEKFMLDGRHGSTGGDNHVILGGASPADSPFLRRPDLLRSLLTYWQHHPALSYLFSSSFIGATSLSPRVDEQGSPILDALERAFEKMEKHAAPQVTDRVLRHLLVDLHGNPHRAEFSINKLFSPDSATGKLGLLALRGFDMPPHPQMSLTLMLLIRALVAHFWVMPYRHQLVRWGTALHDRFMLPHFIWRDFAAVISELNEAGYPFRLEWFAPFFEFRFPFYGCLQAPPVALELRMALEPQTVSGSAELERMQIKCSGLDTNRFLVTCNGRRLPLQATGIEGEYVAGVRYQAWPSPAGLQVDAPLTFDLFDKQLGRVVDGCVYHVVHPGGRAYHHLPVNAYEAETRRVSRFADWGHTIADSACLAGGREPPEEPLNQISPCTLDLKSLV
jgi:transglutaminase-like putative cysteine protease